MVLGGGVYHGNACCIGCCCFDSTLVFHHYTSIFVHLPSFAAPKGCLLLLRQVSLTPACYQEVERYMSALRSCFASQRQQLVGFERFLTLSGKGGNHCHINALGVSKAAAARAGDVFQDKVSQAGFSLEPVPAKDGHIDRWGGDVYPTYPNTGLLQATHIQLAATETADSQLTACTCELSRLVRQEVFV